jgi:hypothetical protein
MGTRGGSWDHPVRSKGGVRAREDEAHGGERDGGGITDTTILCCTIAAVGSGAICDLGVAAVLLVLQAAQTSVNNQLAAFFLEPHFAEEVGYPSACERTNL